MFDTPHTDSGESAGRKMGRATRAILRPHSKISNLRLKVTGT